ncbi:cysteine--1-D-myo-inosityl 2-amino-2-deoxy-alpha-D-glucopyranoside ligase [Herbiconiux sp. KACC 21604]|uniref:cysteine--1-D-myo-inosityl 2-amino-2-deoxy-alpha-D-glucopyranoside ligase n=1 Tax=unclassified Herbiconiux TaxID=2618217 RepID=UPI0014912F2C|nr:cysteine--1-D-myo-inosityl 2-amino-2-deoxy-alpha-D-glucopyranoside ligase [Herbiconiux sp. SALV-R1]QJU53516.1 cysteine--1-D-myo-inosityl 2-amino-2-deoxy-alpha-D-glucopyranoside ligase [Herbiconiux sp. SALV-R1]WPO88494.1 cysteine--1-D-myo-inosityl 2-amino-2-deoxy-alpha-D-glucopyranoside ligase [Herbiconiux sp. KACC 21604]
MRSWTRPALPKLPGRGLAPRLHDDASGQFLASAPGTPSGTLYVCGITPYDATHIGHAATYIAFDTVVRMWLDAGLDVSYTQNITDVDDPLLERATATGVDWRELAESQIELFRTDMAALAVVPPDSYLGVTETIQPIADAVDELRRRGIAYAVDTPDAAVPKATDWYFDIAAAEAATPWTLGSESGLDRETMARLFAERGGDPERPGKRDPLDPLLWRAERVGEPAWESVMGRGRPGWHIECSVIARQTLGDTIAVQGGGGDLVFPHHEFSAAHATALTGERFARVNAHGGLVAFDGEKMSKSLGNLVLVSQLREAGVEPGAIRLAILTHPYRDDWEWHRGDEQRAAERLAAWRRSVAELQSFDAAALDPEAEDARALELVDAVRARLHDDLDTPGAVDLFDDWFGTPHTAAANELAADALDALLGVRL